jgi:hypothetical protein
MAHGHCNVPGEPGAFMKKKFISLCVIIAGIFSAQAWNAEGHMVVAQIAYNHLNPVAKARCDALIAISVQYASTSNSNFVTAACWADDIKSFTSAYGNWHYIDLPFSLDGTATSGVTTASFDVVRAISQCITNLQSPTALQSNHAVSLRFLLHFAGDIQQPLHCSTAVSAAHTTGDGGGNSFSTLGTWTTLHSLWDNGGGYLSDSVLHPLDTPSQNILNAKVTAIETQFPYNYSTNLSTMPDPMTWALEGFNLAKTNTYVGITSGTAPTTAYLNAAMATTQQRMAQGGHRLADLLNTLFPVITIGTVTRTNGNFSFSWNAVSNVAYQVQSKTNLTAATWTVLTNFTATSGTAAFKETNSAAQKFYRVVQ